MIQAFPRGMCLWQNVNICWKMSLKNTSSQNKAGLVCVCVFWRLAVSKIKQGEVMEMPTSPLGHTLVSINC